MTNEVKNLENNENGITDSSVMTLNIPVNDPQSVKLFNTRVSLGFQEGFRKFRLVLTGLNTYPNVCAPLAGLILHYKKQGISFEFQYENDNDYVQNTRIDSPLQLKGELKESELKKPFDKVWMFSDSDEVSELISAYMMTLRIADVVEAGVLSGIEWCLNEIMDNVLNHSNAPAGYVMAQLHREKKLFSVCVFDAGVGIYRSLKNSKHAPDTPLEAIKMAIKEKVTRDENVGQGNGMWGFSRILDDAQGSLSIRSTGAKYSKEHGLESFLENDDLKINDTLGTTTVDFQLDYSRRIDIAKALNGHQPMDLWTENLEDEKGDPVISIAQLSEGTGTRKAAAKMRNMILNIVLNEKKKVVLDFASVGVLSSSYADELIGKIVGQYGFIFFMTYFRIKNLNSLNAALLNRSVQQRMGQTYYGANS